MHPRVFEEYEAIGRQDPSSSFQAVILKAHHFHVGRSICSAAVKLADHHASNDHVSDADLMVPEDARLPGDFVVLTIDDDGPVRVFLLWRPSLETDNVAVIEFSKGRPVSKVGFVPSKPAGWILADRQLGMDHFTKSWSLAWYLSFILSLINTPRLVERVQMQASRPQRRRMQRTIGQPALGFTEVRWTIGKATKAKIGEAGSGRGLPLHWNRAHWRVAKEGDPKAEWREAGPHGSGWYTWVTDYWAGHPDFGLKLQHHVPQIEGEARSRPGALAPSKSLSGERLAVMNEVKRNALIAAGYAAA